MNPADGGVLSFPAIPMPSKFSASSTNFVVRAPVVSESTTFRHQLEKFGTVETLPGHPDLLVLHLESAPAQSKKTWEQLRKTLGPGTEIFPVLLDDNGSPHYPLGTLTARFRQPLSDSALAELLEPLGLQVKSRNKYVPTQISLQALEPSQHFLPDVLNAVGQLGDKLVDVWPETLMHFRRG